MSAATETTGEISVAILYNHAFSPSVCLFERVRSLSRGHSYIKNLVGRRLLPEDHHVSVCFDQGGVKSPADGALSPGKP